MAVRERERERDAMSVLFGPNSPELYITISYFRSCPMP